jgi:hypothetical protein
VSSAADPILASRRAVLVGRILSAIAIAFLSMDALGKFLRPLPVIDGTRALGYDVADLGVLGVLLATGVILYAIPRTALLGAIYLTGYLGGALASHLRIGSPLLTHVLFAVYVALVLWTGLALRRAALAGSTSVPRRVATD